MLRRGDFFEFEDDDITQAVVQRKEMNSHALPRHSMYMPLRTLQLDRSVLEDKPARTQTELKRRMKAMNLPHPSFDIDGDGIVDQFDLRIAKECDINGNGKISPRERVVAQRRIAHDFFNNHKEELWKFGADFAARSVEENAAELSKARNFAQRLRALKYKERAIEGHGSQQVTACFPKLAPISENDGIGGIFGGHRSHKPYSVDAQYKSGISTYSELKHMRAQENVKSGQQWLVKAEKNLPPVSFKRVNAFFRDSYV